jgi:hypothetical protein
VVPGVCVGYIADEPVTSQPQLTEVLYRASAHAALGCATYQADSVT